MSRIEIVVARYNEDLRWINEKIFRNYPVICYNKGVNDNFKIDNPNQKIINLPNIGRCDHTYLYHIINNYDNLADITFFFPGSNNMSLKYRKSCRLIQEVEKHNTTIFIGQYFENGVKAQLYPFKLEIWEARQYDNKLLNSESELTLSEIRPFGKWYEHYFGDIKIHYVSHCSILAIHKKHILQHTKEYYENLIKQLEVSSNPEVGHYFERSWEAVFYPLTDAIFIN